MISLKPASSFIKKILKLTFTCYTFEIPFVDVSEPELENLELSYEIKLTHHKQKSNWDCGISCVLMILPAEKREYYLNNTNSILKSEGICKSTWSIDLCYLLKRFNVHFIYYTITKGIHPGYKNHNFYDKILQKVSKICKNLMEQGLNSICLPSQAYFSLLTL